MLRPRSLVGAAILTICAVSAAAAREVSVVDPLGNPVAGALLACLEPGSSVPVLSAKDGHAVLAASCRRTRCEAANYLPGEVELRGDAARCLLRAASLISGELPAAVAATGLEARLFSSATAPIESVAVPKAALGKSTAAFAFSAAKPGRYSLEVARKSDGWACRADLGPLSPGRQLVAPAWREASNVNVRVKNADGKPVSEIPVRAFAPRPLDVLRGRSATPIGAWICAQSSTAPRLTDTNGTARLSIDLSGEALIAAGDWKDPRGLAYTVLDRVPSQAVALTLALPVRVRAKVMDDKERPSACDALFEPLPFDLAWLADALPGATIKAACDPEGRLALGPLTSTPLTLDVRPRTGMPMRISVAAPALGATADLGVLRVRSGERIRVVVKDEAERPVPGASVTARASAGIALAVMGSTEKDGGVDLTGFPKNAVMTISAKARGFVETRQTGLDGDGGPFIVRLARGAAISGKVHDSDGGGIGSARLNLSIERGDATCTGTADSDGAFDLDGLEDGSWSVVATATGYAASEPASVEIRDHKSVSDLSLTLRPAQEISGKVVDSVGAAVAGARVILSDMPDVGTIAPIAEADSGSDGTFHLRAADPSAWLVATKSAFGPCATRAPNASSRTAELVLTLTEPASLTVHLPNGVSTMRRLVVNDGAGVRRLVPASGATELTFADLAPGRGTTGLFGAAQREVSLVAHETADVTLAEGAVVEGRVSFEGEPAPRVYVSAANVAATGARLHEGGGSFTDERGWYRIDGIPEGSYRIVAVGEDGRAEVERDLADGDTSELDLVLRAVRLVITVVDGATQKPISGVSVGSAQTGKHCNAVMGASTNVEPGELGFDILIGSNGCLSTHTDAAGMARLALAAPGTYDLGAGIESYEGWQQTVALGEGTTTKRVSLTRKPGESEKKPQVYANLRTDPPGLLGAIVCSAGNNTNSSSHVAGRYDCGEMVPGPGEILFQVEGYGRGHAAFEVPKTGELVVDVDVLRGGTIVVPVSQAPNAQPVLVDGWGFAWADPNVNGRVLPTLEDVPNIGRAWVFRDMPPSTYTVTLEGKSRSPVPLATGGTAIAY